MKRVSMFIIVVSIFSAGVIFSWIFFKYFHTDKPSELTFAVTRGNITETVRIRGEAVSQKEFNLSFSFGGTVTAIMTTEGEIVKEGDKLVKIDTASYELETNKLSAILVQRQLNLEKLLAGYTAEDIAVAEVRVSNAKRSLADKKKNLADYLNDSYTKVNSAVGIYVDQFYDNPRASNAKINVSVNDSQLKIDLENGRVNVEKDLITWQELLGNLTDENLILGTEKAGTYLDKTRGFLDQLATTINALIPSSGLTATTIGTYRSDISSARTAINTAITNLSAALESTRVAESALTLTDSELKFKVAGPRAEDIASARAQITEAESDLASARDRIRKATIVAPVESRVMKISVERGETVVAGETAVILASSQNKIQADVSELDIVKIPEEGGSSVEVRFDAFPDMEFTGKVISIEPKEVVKDGDTYYRVNFYLDAGDTPIRSGMKADLEIYVAEKTEVLLIPSFTIYQENRKNFVKVSNGKKTEEVSVVIGLNDGENTEIVSGLSEGQIIVVSAN